MLNVQEMVDDLVQSGYTKPEAWLAVREELEKRKTVKQTPKSDRTKPTSQE